MWHIFPVALFVALVAAGTVEVSAQFSMDRTTQDTHNISMPIPFEPRPIRVKVINDAEARVIRKELWRRHNDVDFQISATGLITKFNKSWVKDNQDAFSGDIVTSYKHLYTKNRFSFNFTFEGKYGMNYIDDIWFKYQDWFRIYNLAAWAIKEKGFLKDWKYSASAEFISQFSEGFKSRTEKDIPWSNFMAPGTFNFGAGLTYISPNKKLPFIVTVNPVSVNALFVMDDRLSDDRRKNLGIPVPRKADGSVIRNKIEGGSNLNVGFNRTFAFGKKRGITLQYNTTLSSFYGWMTELAKHDDGNTEGPVRMAIRPTMSWTNAIIFNPIRVLALEFRATTLYDRSQVDKLQMQYSLKVGITYRYKNK